MHTSPPLNYGSVCSGIESVSLAWQPLGLHPAWFAEIDAFPSAVLAHHYPTIPNLGDMTRLAPQVLSGAVAAPDILVGGTPCQSFSIAGLRQGITDPRGALTLSYVELANAIDQTRLARNESPTVIVWENVPGVLSDRNNAFGCFLGALCGEGHPLQPAGHRWTDAGYIRGPQRAIAWVIKDAQFFGVPQRRRRVFLVASARTDLDPAAVLFEPHSLQRHFAPGSQTGQDTAANAPRHSDSSGDYSAGLNAAYGAVTTTVCFGGGNTRGPIQNAACLTAHGYRSDFEVETFVTQQGVGTFAQNGRGEVRFESNHGQISGTLMSSGKPGYGIPAIAFQDNAPYPTLRASHRGDEGQIIMPGYEAHYHYSATPPDSNGKKPWAEWRVRRLMPVECERLQGLPDHYTQVPYRGKPATDTPRYQAIGNAMAVPCLAWLGKRLLQVLGETGEQTAPFYARQEPRCTPC